ncbi:GmrSD restriction endonuclease domain-containing protein [Kineococcus sp. SYSU DK001]|uniref:GmrSD restriction endonuclease domain-containing protein n=1 Tax=Kineococcus sp. SYSU DK001 TaxID=3383122 RepID=UPI003D7CB869
MPTTPAPPHRRPTVAGAAAVAGAVAALLLGGCSPAPVPADPPAAGTAAEQLAALPVKGRAPKTGYSREAFGDGWVDTDRNGCDTRNDVLARDLTAVAFRPGTRDCVIASGTLADPYGGGTVAFVRGEGTSEAVQIDHVVALSNAWQTGAQQWDADRRARFANDPLELLAVDGPLNSAKGDGDAATWLPPNTGFRCAYVARQVAVKAAYGLWVTPAERDAIARVLDTCPDQPVAQASSPAPTGAAGDGPDPRFASCRDANAAGHGPYVAGTDPEYDWYRDTDGDGTVCE